MIIGNVILSAECRAAASTSTRVMILLSLAFWERRLGASPAAFLFDAAHPSMAMVILAQFDGSRWILGVILSADGPDPPATEETSGPMKPPDVNLPKPRQGGRLPKAKAPTRQTNPDCQTFH